MEASLRHSASFLPAPCKVNIGNHLVQIFILCEICCFISFPFLLFSLLFPFLSFFLSFFFGGRVFPCHLPPLHPSWVHGGLPPCSALFYAGSHSVTQANLELVILLPQSPRITLPHLAFQLAQDWNSGLPRRPSLQTTYGMLAAGATVAGPGFLFLW